MGDCFDCGAVVMVVFDDRKLSSEEFDIVECDVVVARSTGSRSRSEK
jgi:hypothetical protein